jgi:DNA-binding NarL/FixJ family response regulator
MKQKRIDPDQSARKRILVLDDHPMTRQGITEMVNRERDLMVCGEAENVAKALKAVQASPPDLVVADITLPGKSGLEFIKDMKALHPNVPVLALSMHNEMLYAERVLRAGGCGYIMKNEGGAQLLKAIRQVLKGDLYVSNDMSAVILRNLSGKRSPHQKGSAALSTLTDREFEVLQLIGQGLTTRQISQRLHISPKTIDSHRLHIKAKLQLRTMPELMSYAVRWAASEEMAGEPTAP